MLDLFDTRVSDSMCLIRLSQFLSNHLMVHSNGVLQYLLHCNKSFNVICNWFLEKYPLSFLELFIYSFQLYRSFGYCYNLFILVFFMGINCKKKKNGIDTCLLMKNEEKMCILSYPLWKLEWKELKSTCTLFIMLPL